MSINIGAVLNANEITTGSLQQIKDAGFKTINIFFWETLSDTNLNTLAELIENVGIKVSCLSIFGNPLREDLKGEDIREGWKTLIKDSSMFGNPYVSGFAGRMCGKSIPSSIESWKELFSTYLDYSYKKNCKGLLFENCPMGDTWKTGKWNIAINPDAWELMFNELDDEKLGLQWEPCHQVKAFADPIKQLHTWVPRVKHIHGKDGKNNYELLKEKGLYGREKVFTHTLPGMGETSWKAIFEILYKNNYKGSIDLEFQGELFLSRFDEAKTAFSYLQGCNKGL